MRKHSLRGVTIGTTFGVILGILIFGSPQPVEAYCVQPFTADPLITAWGKETTPNQNTCDGDGIYKGKVFDILTDGSCVWVQFREGSTVYTQATSCNASGINYTFWDQNGNSFSDIRICRSQGCSLYRATQNY